MGALTTALGYRVCKAMSRYSGAAKWMLIHAEMKKHAQGSIRHRYYKDLTTVIATRRAKQSIKDGYEAYRQWQLNKARYTK